jgi:hypothetical protein
MSPTLLSPVTIHRKDTQPMPMQSSRMAGLVPELRDLPGSAPGTSPTPAILTQWKALGYFEVYIHLSE